MSFTRLRLFLSLLVSCAFSAAPVAHAQGVNGTILGTIQDQQGGAIGKAEVSVKSLDTGVVRKSNTQDNGDYRITGVPAGSYEVSIAAPGFKTEVRSPIDVTVGADVNVNFAMTVGAVSGKGRSDRGGGAGGHFERHDGRLSSIPRPSANCR